MTIPQEIQDLMPEKMEDREIAIDDGSGLYERGFNQALTEVEAVLPQMLALVEKRGAERVITQVANEIREYFKFRPNTSLPICERLGGEQCMNELLYFVERLEITQPNHD